MKVLTDCRSPLNRKYVPSACVDTTKVPSSVSIKAQRWMHTHTHRERKYNILYTQLIYQSFIIINKVITFLWSKLLPMKCHNNGN